MENKYIFLFLNNTWTQVEKAQLLEALRKYGATDIEKITGDLPYKSFCDVRTIISKYQTLAVRSLTEESSSTTPAGAPIDMWINLMKQILTRDNNNIISRLLKYIALFETREKGNVNLEDCYMVLSDLTNGHPSKELDDKTAAFFYGCLTKLAKSVKENDDDKEETYLDSLEFNKLSATKTYRSKADSNVLLSDVNLNPCRVPANLLVDQEK